VNPIDEWSRETSLYVQLYYISLLVFTLSRPCYSNW